MTHTPHDALVRAIFGQPHYAAEELRAVLPPGLLAQMQLDSLALDEPRIPPIVPLLLHHGPRPWPWKPSFSSVLNLDDRQRATFGPALLAFDFALDDLARQTDAQILGRASDAIVRLTLLSLRNGRSHPRLFELVADAMSALKQELRRPAVGPALERLARYALEVGEEPFAIVRAAFAKALVPKNRSEVMVSTADMLRAEARRETLLDLLEVKFGSVDPATRTRIEDAANEQVVAWIRRAAVVSSLEAVFAG